MDQKNKIYIFSHIPKTAGTTFRVHFQNHLKDQEEFIHLANRGNKWAKEAGLRPYIERSIESRCKAKVILGHKVTYKTKQLVPNCLVEEVVFFRNPIDWEISRFNQYVNRQINTGKHEITFDHWVNNVNKTHSQFKWFLSNYLQLGGEINKLSYKSIENLLFYTLDNFKHVYFVDQFDEKSAYFFDKLNIPQKAKKENVVGKQKKQFFIKNKNNNRLLNQLCVNEMTLYNKVKNSFK